MATSGSVRLRTIAESVLSMQVPSRGLTHWKGRKGMRDLFVRFMEWILPSACLDFLEMRSVFARSEKGKFVKLYRPYRI